jgi:hypothetical protein
MCETLAKTTNNGNKNKTLFKSHLRSQSIPKKHFSITKINLLNAVYENISVYTENHKKFVNTKGRITYTKNKSQVHTVTNS